MGETEACIFALVVVFGPIAIYGHILDQREKIRKLEAEKLGESYRTKDWWEDNDSLGEM
jgi:hypothetical protein